MSEDLVYTLLIYLSLGIIIYSYLSEIYNTYEKQSYLPMILLLAFLAIMGYWVYQSYQSDQQITKTLLPETVDPDEITMEQIPESESSSPPCPPLPTHYQPLKRSFQLSEGCSDIGGLNYSQFKRLCQYPEFINQFTKAIHEALQIQKTKLIKVRNRWISDLQVMKRKKKSALVDLLEKNDESKNLESIIQTVDTLLHDVQTRQKQISPETTQKALHTAIYDPTHGIESLTGRDNIKDFLSLQLYTFAQNPAIFFDHFQNLAIYGPAGVGKTKLAEVIGHVYASSGILIKNHVHVITKQSLTTAYVNESGKMTRRLLMSNLGSLVFIDEAYDLSPPHVLGKGWDHGHEAIAEIVNFLDKMMGLSIVIVAGYEKEMEERFMNANEGLPRRFPHKLVLTPYSASELTNLLLKFLTQSCHGLAIKESQANFLYSIISYLLKQDPEVFKNQAGDMANLSGFIARSIYGTPGKTWEQSSDQLILNGINSYLGLRKLNLKVA